MIFSNVSHVRQMFWLSNFLKYVSLTNTWVVTLILFTDFGWKMFLLVNQLHSGDPVNEVTNCRDFAVNVHILVSMAKTSISYYLCLELRTLGKWTYPPYTCYVLTVNKKQSIWEKRLMGSRIILSFLP